jgi:hypothetical protein
LFGILHFLVVEGRVLRQSKHQHSAYVVDTSSHQEHHIRLLTQNSPVRSAHLHEIAIEREQAKGMWFPSHPIPHILQKHPNSIFAKASLKKPAMHKANDDSKKWINLPETFSGREDESIDILQRNGFDVSPLFADRSPIAAIDDSALDAIPNNHNRQIKTFLSTRRKGRIPSSSTQLSPSAATLLALA